MEAIYEYNTGPDDFPIHERISQKYTKLLDDPATVVDRTYEFDLKEADVPESAFTLKAFGFPEPGKVRRPAR